MPLFPHFSHRDARLAVRVGDQGWSYVRLADAASEHAERMGKEGIRETDRVAIWAMPSLSTVAAMIGNLSAGITTVPLNPKLGVAEVRHVFEDSRPKLVFCAAGFEVPHHVEGTRLLQAEYQPAEGILSNIPTDDMPGLILYTSGTTGLPKGAVITRANIAANLDSLAEAWQWSELDTVVHSLPLIHAHGLVLGLFGSLRAGGALHFVPKFSPEAIADALEDPEHQQTMLFTVPTMVHRLAEAAEQDERVRDALRRPRLFVSGSAGLSLREHQHIQRLTGRGVHERYGLTETLINCGVPASHAPMPGYVGPPLPGVELRLVDERRNTLDAYDDETIGEVAVRSASVFAGYLNRADATAEVVDAEGWFYTGDLATRAPDGAIRILGRRSTDLIKSGGYRIGAGEIEACLLDHASVSEAAIVGLPDDDLGQRIAAFIVLRDGAQGDPDALVVHVAEQLSPHKRPREVHFVEELPRNAMGKVQKKKLADLRDSAG
jgi:malonyl-CoA/methylmalonyl-CoA synthetase